MLLGVQKGEDSADLKLSCIITVRVSSVELILCNHIRGSLLNN
jgi:hypothetical protein